MGVYVASGFIPEYIPARSVSPLRSQGWWLNRWPFLGWLETFLKMAAWVYAFLTPLGGSTRFPESYQWGTGLYKVETGLLTSLAALMVAAIGDRIFYREIISIFFVFPQMASAVLIALTLLKGRGAISVRNFRVYLWLQFLGDLTKLIFFVVHDFKIKKVAKSILYTLQFYFFVCYGIALFVDYSVYGYTTYFRRVPT